MQQPLDPSLAAARHADDAMLLRRAVRGDPDAVRVLVRRLMPVIRARVRRTCARRGMSLDDQSDLAQEVWLVLIDRGGDRLLAYDPDRGATLEGYVGMITDREVGNILQRLAAQKRGGDRKRVVDAQLDQRAADDPSPEQTVATEELAARLGQHLEEALPPRGLLIFRLVFTDHHSPAAVAKMLGINTQVVYNWQHRIRQVARAFMSTQSPG